MSVASTYRKSTPSIQSKVSYSTTSSPDDAFLLPPKPASRAAHQQIRRRFLSGWRIGALLSLLGVVLALALNVGLIIWVWNNSAYKAGDATGTLMTGSCIRVRQLNVWVHLLVNALGTALLCASNYCMQVLIAPNRAEVDRAHASQRWFHIGVPSPHNLKIIAPSRSFLWALLMLSSLPLHLLYNSIIFTNLQANEYIVIPTQEGWLYGASYNFSGFLDFPNSTLVEYQSELSSYQPQLNDTTVLNNGTTVFRYKNVTTENCLHNYNNQYMSEFGNVYLIQAEPPVWRNLSVWHLRYLNNSQIGQWFWGDLPEDYYEGSPEPMFPFLIEPSRYPSNTWRCLSYRSSSCDVDGTTEVPQNQSNWKPYESPVRYCMVEQVPEICQLRFSFLIAKIIIFANCVKLVCIAAMLYFFGKQNVLVTLGDALASFLDRPDPETRHRCLQSLIEIKSQWNGGKARSKLSKQRFKILVEARPKRYKLRSSRWGYAPSVSRWSATYGFYICVVSFGFFVMDATTEGMPHGAANLWKTGFGVVNGRSLLTFKTNLIQAILLVNSPQIVLSYLYISFNGLYTTMFIGKEWSTYFNERKTLRVTAPAGQQRNTYWLSVPFRYATPLAVLSSLLHWLASQAFFMVQITVTDAKTRAISPDDQISTGGYSPFAIILTTVTVTVMALGGILLSYFKYPPGMPLAASCSAAISAACHPPAEDVDASLLPVQWGATTHGRVEREGEDLIGHCTFSSFPVEPPIPGRLYE